MGARVSKTATMTGGAHIVDSVDGNGGGELSLMMAVTTQLRVCSMGTVHAGSFSLRYGSSSTVWGASAQAEEGRHCAECDPELPESICRSPPPRIRFLPPHLGLGARCSWRLASAHGDNAMKSGSGIETNRVNLCPLYSGVASPGNVSLCHVTAMMHLPPQSVMPRCRESHWCPDDMPQLHRPLLDSAILW